MVSESTIIRKSLAKTWGRSYRLRYFLLDMLVALSLALLVWLYTRSRGQEILDQVPIPVQLQLATSFLGQYDLEVNGPTRIAVSFSGPPSSIRQLRRQLQRGLVQISLTVKVPEDRQNDSSFRDTVRIEAADVPVPPGVMAVLTEEGNTIPYTIHRLVERHLPVRLDYVGEARLSQIKLDPPTVVVRGPKEILDRLWSINSQPYSLPSTSETTDGKEKEVKGQVSLVSELEGRPLQITPKSVAFSFNLRPRQKIYELAEVPVKFLCPPDSPWRPKFAPGQPTTVALRIVGPAGDDNPPVLAYIDLTAGNVGLGRNLQPVRVQLPRDFQLQDSPPRVAFVLESSEPPTPITHNHRP